MRNVFVKKTKLILKMWSVFFFVSCKNDVPVDFPPFQQKLVIESYITQGDSAFLVRIDRTVNPINKSDWITFDTNFFGTEAVLTLNDSSYKLRQIIDFQEESKYNISILNHGRLFVLNKKVENTDIISLTVDYQTLHVESECAMPSPVRIKSATLTGTKYYSEDYAKEMYSSFKINLKADFPTHTSYYLLRVMREGYDPRRGRWLPYEIARGYYSVSGSTQNKEFILSNLRVPVVNDSIVYTIILSHIEKIHYDFALAVSAQFGELDAIIPTETTEIPTNIRGGYGIFTAMSNDTIRVTIQ